MQLNTKAFIQAINNGSIFASKNRIAPIFECVKITFKQDKIVFTSTDSENTISVSMANDNDEYNGKSICINSKDIVPYVKLINDLSFDFIINDNDIVIKHCSGKKKMPFLSADDFPTIHKEDYKEAELTDINTFCNYIKSASSFIAIDDLRPILCGMCLSFSNNKLRTCCTDGYTMYVQSYKDVFDIDDTDVVINKNGIKAIYNIANGCDKISFKIGKTNIIINSVNGSLCLRLIEGRYAKFDAVIPNDNYIDVKFNTQDAVKAIQRASLSASNSNCLIKVMVGNNKIDFAAEDINLNTSGSETIECESNNEIKIGFKCSTLLNVLSAVQDERCLMTMSTCSRPCLVFNEDTRYDNKILIMPHQIID